MGNEPSKWLLWAAKREDEREIERLPDFHSDTIDDEAKEKALMISIDKRNIKCCELLLCAIDHRATRTRLATNMGKNAVTSGKLLWVKLALNNGMETSTIVEGTMPGLHIAARDGLLDIVRLLLRYGADVQTTDQHGASALFYAAHSKQLECVSILLKNGANVNCQDTNGNTPLHKASENNDHACMRILLENRAVVNRRNVWKVTPLHVASRRGHLRCVNELLARDADVSCKDYADCTPLHIAAEGGYLDCVEKLLEKGVDVNSKCEAGKTALDHASSRNHLDIIPLLQVSKTSSRDTPSDNESAIADMNTPNVQLTESQMAASIQELSIDIDSVKQSVNNVENTQKNLSAKILRIEQQLTALVKELRKTGSISAEAKTKIYQLKAEMTDLKQQVHDKLLYDPQANRLILWSPCAIHMGHLPSELRDCWKKLDDNIDYLAQEMNLDKVADQLRMHNMLTVDQYQHAINKTIQYDANKYLLQLIRSEPPEYLDRLKDGLMHAEQDELLDFLP